MQSYYLNIFSVETLVNLFIKINLINKPKIFQSLLSFKFDVGVESKIPADIRCQVPDYGCKIIIF